ncbi:hypothetical protein MHB42_14925 [Lysinibacillus sp. FSL K6-0232]|uniref:hypothetical protein n=1 Tax=unclassified Lysinibacillus TaxID=2636778 RepID=UPI0030FB726F
MNSKVLKAFSVGVLATSLLAGESVTTFAATTFENSQQELDSFSKVMDQQRI